MRGFYEISWKGEKVGAYTTIISDGKGNYVQGLALSTGETITVEEYEDNQNEEE